jgi:chorismate binding enzyme/Amino-transferase class IV
MERPVALVHHVESLPDIGPAGSHAVGEWRPSLSHQEYHEAIRQIRSEVAAGNTYQINYTWRLSSPFADDPLSLLGDLDRAQRGEWSACVDTGRHVICSASPELFFSFDVTRLTCQPMKGTARRGLSVADDRLRAAALQASGKNRAENVMVVDMTRNDLGRIARVGTVAGPSMYHVARYPAQWQMISTVTAEVDNPSLPALFAALFPSGSVTEEARRRRPEADAVILWNDAGEITEATEANIVVEIEGRRVTPPVDCGLLPGVMRQHLLASGAIDERRVAVDDLRGARAIWLINSVRGWMPAELDQSTSRSL